MTRLPIDTLAQKRLLTATDSHEDAAIVRLPNGAHDKALVQTLDFFTPIVNDPFAFGQIAAANALSDVYAMGGEPWCAMNIVCFPIKELPKDMLLAILEGGSSKLQEAGVVLAGGHSVEDPEIKYGLSVTGFVDAKNFSSNSGLKEGQKLILTKSLGTGILATAIKASWDGHEEFEKILQSTAARLNAGGGKVIRELKLHAATDITGFGLGGHLLEMALASGVTICLDHKTIPILPHVRDLASVGLVPVGSHANRKFRQTDTLIMPNVDPIVTDVIFDAQTSGGIVLAVQDEQIHLAVSMLHDSGDEGYIIGEVKAYPGTGHHLIIQ